MRRRDKNLIQHAIAEVGGSKADHDTIGLRDYDLLPAHDVVRPPPPPISQRLRMT